MTVTVILPIRAISVANAREHVQVKARRNREHRGLARLLVLSRRNRPGFPRPPYVVTLTRVGRKVLDSDNLASACKACRDGVADALGLDDGDVARLRFEYEQRTSKGYEVIVRIEGI